MEGKILKQYSVSQMAEILKITPQGVRKACKEGRLRPAYKIGSFWIIEYPEVEEVVGGERIERLSDQRNPF